MRRGQKLLEQARASPRSLRFEELVHLVEALGFACRRRKGSHLTFKHPGHPTAFLNLQPDGSGAAKPYQVRQVLDHVDELGLELP